MSGSGTRYLKVSVAVGTLVVLFGLLIAMRSSIRRQVDVTFRPAHRSGSAVFSGVTSTGLNIFSLDLTRGTVRQLTWSLRNERQPSLSWDDQWLVVAAMDPYVADTGKTPYRLFVMRPDGSTPRQLTFGDQVNDQYPAFSPDGKTLVFARATRTMAFKNGWTDWGIWVAPITGSAPTRITPGDYGNVSAPSFAPDGSTIVYSASAKGQGGGMDIFLAAPDARTRPLRLTTDGHCSSPSFAPDGRSICFISDRGRAFDYEVWAMDRSGARQRQLTSKGWYLEQPHYTPDGRSILFLADCDRTNRFELWQASVDGNNVHRIAGSTLFDAPLSWKPGE